MATVTKGSCYYYQTNTGGVSQVVGYESKTRRVCRTSFTVDSPCTDLTVKLYASLGNVEYRNCQIYIAVSESDSAYINHTGTDGTFLGSWNASGTKTATITGLVLMPGTTYYLWFYHYADAYAWLYVTPGNITLTASGTPYAALDINGTLDGTEMNGLYEYGTCDVYVNDTLVADDVNDYYATDILMGSTYSITDIKATTGHTYNGVSSGSLSGTLSADTPIRLKFDTNTVKLYYGPHRGIVTADGYSINSAAWIEKDGTSYLNGATPYGSTVTLVPTSTMGLIKPGNTFMGWSPYYNTGGTQTDIIFTDGGTYDASQFYDRIDSTQNVDTKQNVLCALIARWTPNKFTWTVNKMDGSDTISQTGNYGTIYNLSNFPTDRPGFKFKRWYVDIGTNGPINLGFDYKHDSSSLDIYLEAYMDDWSQFAPYMCLISCAQDKGWQIYNSGGGAIEFIMFDDTTGGYQFLASDTKWSDLTPGWHSFRLLFDKTNGYMAGYVDNVFQGQRTLSKIGYNPSCTIFLGARANGGPYDYDMSLPIFPGLMSNVIILNYLGDPPTNHFIGTVDPVTFYAEWEACEYAYVKVDGEWKIGKIYFKHNGNWD